MLTHLIFSVYLHLIWDFVASCKACNAVHLALQLLHHEPHEIDLFFFILFNAVVKILQLVCDNTVNVADIGKSQSANLRRLFFGKFQR